MMNFNLRDKVVLVTGGGSGIGLACARMAAADGAKVAVVDINEAAAEAAVAALRASGAQAAGFTADVRDGAAVKAASDQAEAKLGPIDGVVASAGISRPAWATEMTPEQWSTVIDTNLTGMFNILQAVGTGMVARRKGAMVAIGSVDSLGGHSARVHYSASKFGVAGLVKSLAIEWGRFGVRVNCVAPGVVDTPLLRQIAPTDMLEGVMRDRTPLGRLSTAEDQAAAALFLLSEAAAFITGVVLPVDGGLTAGFFTHHHGADGGSRTLTPQT